jgi:hypothetical protein
MRSPLVLNDGLYKYRHVIKSLIPKNVINLRFPAVRDLEFELYLSNKYNISCSTYDYRIYDFWNTYYRHPAKVFELSKKFFSTIDLEEYAILSQFYHKQVDENVRSALFLLMNRCGNYNNFFMDSFNLHNASLVEDFLEGHTHFLPHNISVTHRPILAQVGRPFSFTIIDLSSLNFENAVHYVEDTSYTINQLYETLKHRKNWCLKVNKSGVHSRWFSTFEYFYLTPSGKRSLSETNKILFYKT